MSPTARSLAYLRKYGWTAEVVERYNSFSKTRNDLFGFVDIFALAETATRTQVRFVQTTTKGNAGARIKKIKKSPHLPLILRCGIIVHVHGWHKVDGRWQVEIWNISQ